MDAYEKIRAALELAREIVPPMFATHAEFEDGLAALAELERAAAEPRLWLAEPVAGDYATYENDAVSSTPEEAIKRAERCHYAEFRPVPLYTAPPPAPVAEMREPTPEECERIITAWWKFRGDKSFDGRAMFQAVASVELLGKRMSAHEKIRKALNTGDANDLLTAMAALAELERAAKEPPAPVAEMREPVEVDDAMCERVFNSELPRKTKCSRIEIAVAREWLAAWRAELGPTLGMVEWREPAQEECERICFAGMKIHPTQSWPAIRGRAMFDAVRAVMWPKGGGS